MKRAIAVFAIALAAISSARADWEIPFNTDRISVPADSPVHYSGSSKKYGDEPVATFPGKFLLTGTYYYGDNDFNDSGDQNPSKYIFDPTAYIVPDAVIAARLPHFVARGGPSSIFLKNPVAFARAVVPDRAARRVRCRTCGVASGHIAIWVDQLTIGIVCDKPDYEAHFLSIDRSRKLTLVPRPSHAC
ncbi:MAG TPA: hypothetical protein VFA87_01245 [Rhizomicrobium sp.]|nr:hypothetical protein [Rhizomicrobium sp.]